MDFILFNSTNNIEQTQTIPQVFNCYCIFIYEMLSIGGKSFNGSLLNAMADIAQFFNSSIDLNFENTRYTTF